MMFPLCSTMVSPQMSTSHSTFSYLNLWRSSATFPLQVSWISWRRYKVVICRWCKCWFVKIFCEFAGNCLIDNPLSIKKFLPGLGLRPQDDFLVVQYLQIGQEHWIKIFYINRIYDYKTKILKPINFASIWIVWAWKSQWKDEYISWWQIFII